MKTVQLNERQIRIIKTALYFRSLQLVKDLEECNRAISNDALTIRAYRALKETIITTIDEIKELNDIIQN